MCVFWRRSLSYLRTKSAETWSLKGRTIRTVGLSPGKDIGCWSSAFEATKILMVVLISCCGSGRRLFSIGHILQKNTTNMTISDTFIAHIDMALVVEQETLV